jgi:hypothetical protein
VVDSLPFAGMDGADIVMGYPTSAGQPCFRGLYATVPAGPPQDSDFPFSKASLTATTTELRLQFTRPSTPGTTTFHGSPSHSLRHPPPSCGLWALHLLPAKTPPVGLPTQPAWPIV